MDTVGSLVGCAGNFGDTSLTIINSTLDKSGKNPSAVSQYTVETEDNIPDVTWTLLPNPSLDPPRMSVNELETLSRKCEEFTSEDQKAEMKWVNEFATRSKNEGFDVPPQVILARYQAHARNFPDPEDFQKWYKENQRVR